MIVLTSAMNESNSCQEIKVQINPQQFIQVMKSGKPPASQSSASAYTSLIYSNYIELNRFLSILVEKLTD